MTDKHRCSGLSKGWWWLLTLIGLASLYFLMLSSKWESIEKDIQTRTSEKLSSSGSKQVTVEIKKRGRDVLLNGTVSTEAERNKAIETAKAVRGVRIIEDNIKVVALISPNLSLSSNAGKVTLSGTMPSQESIDTLLNATVSIYGTDNVENKLSIGKNIASPSWLSNINPLISDLKNIKNAGLELSADTQKISGIVRTEDNKSTVLSKFTALFNDKVIDQLTIQPLKKPSLIVNYKDGKVTVGGLLGSQEKIDEVINNVAEKVGKDNIINKLTLNDDYSNTDGTINLIGEATSKSSHSLVISAVQQSGKALGLNFENKLTLNDLEAIALAKAQRIAQEKAAAEKAKAERIAQEKAAVEKAEAERIAKEKAAAEKAEADRIAQEKAAAEKAEAERMAQEKEAAEKAEAERIVQEKEAAEKAEAERIVQEKAVAEKAEAERIAQEKAAAEKAEAERMAQEKEAAEKVEAERIAQEKAAAEKAEAERIAQEKAAAEKAEAERMAQEKAAAEKAEAERIAQEKAAEVLLAKKLAEKKAIKVCQSKLNQVMVGKTILFRTNKANIKRASFPLLNNIVSVIKECHGNVENTKIEVSGHTDSRGSNAYNLQLSQRRANAVSTYLTEKGVDQSIVTSTGYGETQPVASNATSIGRSQNRRITFSVK